MSATTVDHIYAGTKILVNMANGRTYGQISRFMKGHNEQKITVVGVERGGYIPTRIGNQPNYMLIRNTELTSLIEGNEGEIFSAANITDIDHDLGRLWDYDGLWETRDGARLKLDSSTYVTFNDNGRVSTLHKEPTSRPSYELRVVKEDEQIFPSLLPANIKTRLPHGFSFRLDFFNMLLTQIKIKLNTPLAVPLQAA